jgi:hypothetical protein
MKYLCMCYYDTHKFATLSADDFKAIGEGCKHHDEALRASRKMTILGSMSEPNKWKSIRPVNEKPTVSDGPMSENKEQIGAFFIVDAEDIEEAVRIASLHPSAHLGKFFGGGIEVSACDMFEQVGCAN